jgi:dipeptidyl aminopeptidase/acylaminoacyl peptidase
MKKLILLLLIVLVNLSIQADLFQATDLHKMRKLSSPVVSPDNNYVIYSLKIWDEKTGISSSHLEYVNVATNKTGILTNPNGYSDYSPFFNKNYPGFLFFLTNRANSTQVFFLSFPIAEGQDLPIPNQLTNYPIEIANVKFVANSLVFSAEIYFDCLDDPLICTSSKNSQIESRGSNTWDVYTKMFVRHWDTWLVEGKGSHLFLQKVEINSQSKFPSLVSDPIDLMKGMEANSPVGPDGGSEQYDIRPDGLEVTLTAHLRTREESWKTGWKIYSVNLSSSPFLISNTDARTQNPRYSPDGTKIAFLSMIRPGLESDNLHLEVFDSLTKATQKITDFFDRSIVDYSWINGNTISFTATDINTNRIFIFNLDAPQNTLVGLTQDQFFYSAAPIEVDYSKGTYIVQRSAWTTPDELAIFKLDQRNLRLSSQINRFVNPNQDYLSKFNLKDAESFLFTGGYNDQVQGWILKPVDFDIKKKYPLAYLIHGGPEGTWDPAWSYRWNPQLWSQRGYAVVMINPHGSTGQGINFQDAVRDDWGGVPYQDLMTGLDFVLAKYTYIDSGRMCACGASYGGYMVNWIQGHTDRFKCLVTHDGVFSTLSMFYATEELWFPYSEYCPRNALGCSPYDAKYRDHYLKFSPESYVQNWKTPHLIIHGSRDYRIPISEGLSAFTALQLKGIKSKLLHFYEENHWVLRPENSIKWYSEVIGWLDEFTNIPSSETSQKFLEKALEYLE